MVHWQISVPCINFYCDLDADAHWDDTDVWRYGASDA